MCTGTWSYVSAICVCVVLDRHLVCLVLAALWLCVKWGALMKEGNGPCKIPNLSHLL